MTSATSISWEKELRKNICTNFGRGIRVNGENSVGFSEQHTRRILRHLFSEEIIIRQDQKNSNGRPNHLYGSKKS